MDLPGGSGGFDPPWRLARPPRRQVKIAARGGRIFTFVNNCKSDVYFNTQDVLSQFREHKLNIRRVGKDLNELKKTINLYPVSSAECERGFSAMNLQHTDCRNRLHTETVSSLLMIQINGPQLVHWPAKKYVLTWLKKGRHSAIDKITGKVGVKTVSSHKSGLFCRPISEMGGLADL